MAEGVFLTDGGILEDKIFPNSVFVIKASDEQIKERIKHIPA